MKNKNGTRFLYSFLVFLILISTLLITASASTVSILTEETKVANMYYEVLINEKKITEDIEFYLVNKETNKIILTAKTDDGILKIPNVPFGKYLLKTDEYKEIEIVINKEYAKSQHVLKQLNLKSFVLGEKTFITKLFDNGVTIIYLHIHANIFLIIFVIIIILIQIFYFVKKKKQNTKKYISRK